MAALSELKTARANAGARYAAAVTELRASLIDLAAHDQILLNRNVRTNLRGDPLEPTFSLDRREITEVLRHPVFAPNSITGMFEEITPARDVLFNGVQAS